MTPRRVLAGVPPSAKDDTIVKADTFRAKPWGIFMRLTVMAVFPSA